MLSDDMDEIWMGLSQNPSRQEVHKVCHKMRNATLDEVAEMIKDAPISGAKHEAVNLDWARRLRQMKEGDDCNDNN